MNQTNKNRDKRNRLSTCVLSSFYCPAASLGMRSLCLTPSSQPTHLMLTLSVFAVSATWQSMTIFRYPAVCCLPSAHVTIASTLRAHTLQAFASFAAALTVKPSHLEALLAYAAVQKACGQLLDALKYLEKAYSVHPADARVQQAYATALTAWGEAACSVHICQQCACSHILFLFLSVMLCYHQLQL